MQLAVQYAQRGAYVDAQKILRQVVSADRTDVAAWLLLGQVCGMQNAHAAAEEAFAQAAALNPGSLDAQAYLGVASMRQGKNDQAINAFKAALAIRPRLTMALVNLVTLLHKLDRQNEALPYQQQWLALEPHSSEAHYSAAVLYQTMRRLPEARRHYEEVLKLGATGVSLYSTELNLGVVCHELKDFDAAVAHGKQALSAQPSSAVAHYNIGNSQKEQGNLAEAIASFEQALKLDPDFVDADSNILFCMNYSPDSDARRIFARHSQWAQRHASRYAEKQMHGNSPDPRRVLRIGYVSADLREHPVGFFMEGVLQNHSGQGCETYCYFNSPQADEQTERLRACAGQWREIASLDDDAVCSMILADEIDILVDLSGHTSGNRLLVFARKPAPVQLTWLGYCNTTGLSAMDYLLADATVIPPDTTQEFSEKVLRLPGSYLCYVAPDYAPAVAPLPLAGRGHVTFGSFNNLAKVTEPVLELWLRILEQVQGSRLVLKSKQLADPAVQQRYHDWFRRHGVASERITLDGRYLDHAGLLRYYGELDIALDTHPYSGVTTTCEALWMGVPVVTLAGDSFISRNSATLLSNVGLTNLIANTAQEYIEKAVALAADSKYLARTRSELRARFTESPLGNGPLFVQNLEAAYRDIWATWCVSKA